ncbi:RNA helicase Mov10l1 [Nymphon striatum]|nr:RNA helicase Mov10l1 [Nymphon striatum]
MKTAPDERSEGQTKEMFGKVTSVMGEYVLVNDEYYYPISSGAYIPELNDVVLAVLKKNEYGRGWTVIKLDKFEEWKHSDQFLSENVCVKQLFSNCQQDFYNTDNGKVNFIETNKIKVNDQEYTLKEDYECDFEITCGDYVTAEIIGNKLKDEWSVYKIEPLRQHQIEGEITCLNRTYGIINKEIYFDLKTCHHGYYPKSGDHVHAEVIESHRNRMIWRALRVIPSISASRVINLFVRHNVNPSPTQSDALQELFSNKRKVSITEKLDFGVLTKDTESKYLTAWIKNESPLCQQLIGIEIQCSGEKILELGTVGVVLSNNKIKAVNLSTSKLIIHPNCESFCNINISPKLIGKVQYLATFVFNGFKIGRYITADIQDEAMALLKAKEPFIQETRNDKESNTDFNCDGIVIPGEKPYRSKNFISNRLPQFYIPNNLMNQYKNNGDSFLNLYPDLSKDLSFENYRQRMSMLLHFEEIQQQINMEKFNMERVLLRQSGEYIALVVPNLAERRPSLLIGDRIILTNPGNSNGPAFEGYIHQLSSNEVFLKFKEEFHNKFDGKDYNVQFKLGRTSMRRCHQSIDLAFKFLGKMILFPSRLEPKNPQITLIDECKHDENSLDSSASENSKYAQIAVEDSKKAINYLEFPENAHSHKQNYMNQRRGNKFSSNSKICDKNNFQSVKTHKTHYLNLLNKSLNERQKCAVKRILLGCSRPVPYVIFGPPGTGKTVTVVEAIAQTFKLLPNSRILATTPSNSAADLIVQRLLDTGIFKHKDIVRLNSFQRNLENVSEEVKLCSKNGNDLEVVAFYRVIICTCMTSGTFYSLGLKEGHFTHIFVDEAGQATEPECLTAVSFAAGPDCQVVLAGDPMQLGPVLMSVPAKLFGLQTSFLERLMQFKIYERNIQKFKDSGNFDPLLVTKLINNYRSHEAITNFSSVEFYDSELIASADSNITDKFCSWETLRNPNFPVLFHGVVGEDAREGNSPSWFNPAEVMQCIYYLRQLLDLDVAPEDIGIITPYKKQVEKIRLMMNTLYFPSIKVASVEEFQGQEKPVIILSTVRSTSALLSFDVKHNLGFISSPKRFNVAITRAQALLIVVGNPHVLKIDYNWEKFIEYCSSNNSCYGCMNDEEKVLHHENNESFEDES